MLTSITTVGNDLVVTHTAVAVAAGTLYYSTGTTWTSAANTALSTTTQLQSTPQGQKLYIADVKPLSILGSDGVIANTNELSSASIADWTAVGIDKNKDVCLIIYAPKEVCSASADTDQITKTAHGLALGDAVQFYANGGTLPSPLEEERLYWVRDVPTADTFTLSAAPTGVISSLVGDTSLIDLTTDSVGSIQYSTDKETFTYAIADVQTGRIILSATLVNGSSIGYQVGRKLKVFDPVTHVVSAISEDYGVAPLDCPLCCTYRDRVILARGHVWYMSRVSDPLDWDFAADPTDPARAYGGTEIAQGQIIDPLTALVPHSDDYLVMATATSIWICRGDPALGGQIGALSREVGIISSNAWCQLPDASLLFLARQGLFVLDPGGQSNPTAFSSVPLPQELQDVPPVANAISMAYDSQARGIHLYVTPTAGTASTVKHWWIDWTEKTFFPVSVPNGMQPMVVSNIAKTPSDPRYTLLGCFDGYVRRYDPSQTTDDGTTITSYVNYGPFPLGPPGYTGQLLAIRADLGSSSGAVTVALYTGATPELAAASTTVSYALTWFANNSHWFYPKRIAPAARLLISSTTSWAIEGVTIETTVAGRRR